MNIDGYSDGGKRRLLRAKPKFDALEKEELVMRILVALDYQDSCQGCWIRTMQNVLEAGVPGIYPCEECGEPV